MNDGSDERARVALHVVVRGRVQGVGYREFVRRSATALGVSGWARNLSDMRSVEVVATGERAALHLLLERLRDGPRFAHVTAVEAEWSTAGDDVDGFEIRY